MPRDRRSVKRYGYLFWLVPTVSCCLLLACSTTTRHQVLSFFFDGVPDKQPLNLAESPKPDDEVSDKSLPVELEALKTIEPQRIVEASPVRVHPPYQNYQCYACHSADSGLIERTPKQGLCRQCHEGITSKLAYVHGPVAVEDCLFCHHYHGGQFANMLVDQATNVCLRCHDRTDLTEGSHHDDSQKQSCINCHSGHGGSDHYFLKSSKP